MVWDELEEDVNDRIGRNDIVRRAEPRCSPERQQWRNMLPVSERDSWWHLVVQVKTCPEAMSWFGILRGRFVSQWVCFGPVLNSCFLLIRKKHCLYPTWAWKWNTFQKSSSWEVVYMHLCVSLPLMLWGLLSVNAEKIFEASGLKIQHAQWHLVVCRTYSSSSTVKRKIQSHLCAIKVQ